MTEELPAVFYWDFARKSVGIGTAKDVLASALKASEYAFIIYLVWASDIVDAVEK